MLATVRPQTSHMVRVAGRPFVERVISNSLLVTCAERESSGDANCANIEELIAGLVGSFKTLYEVRKGAWTSYTTSFFAVTSVINCDAMPQPISVLPLGK